MEKIVNEVLWSNSPESPHRSALTDAPMDELWLYAVTENGNTYTFSEWQTFLEQAGFVNITREGSIIKAIVP